MTKRKPIKVVYNKDPDPIVSIKEYEYNSDTGKPELVKETTYPPVNKPEYNKQYRLIGKAGEKSIAKGNTWAESEVK